MGPLCLQIADEQIAWWRANGVAIADVIEMLGLKVGPQRHHGRTWDEVRRYLVDAWLDATHEAWREAA